MKAFMTQKVTGRQAHGSRRSSVITCSATSRTAHLRQLLQKPGLLLGPAAYDGISAKLTEEAGFNFAFMSGFSVAGARLAKPDTGLLSYAEMLDQGRCMHEATRSIPIIGDGDTGYGNAMNVQRTVRGYAAAGFAGILIEDQVWPKSCGHVRGKRVVPRDEAIARIRAACDARGDGSDIVIVARTDARQAESFQEARYRAAAFADAGADVVFVDALASVAEMRTLCVEVQGAHKMANMLEGGGKTPILSAAELEDLGFKLCAYPLTLLGVSIVAMRSALAGLKRGEVPMPPVLPTFEELQAVVGFPEYFDQEAKYAVPSSATAGNGSGPQNGGSGGTPPLAGSSPPRIEPVSAFVEPDVVIEPGAGRSADDAFVDGTVDLVRGSSDEDYRRSDSADRRAQWLRIKVSDASSGAVKLDTRFPAGFLGSVAAIIPQVAGLDLEALLRGEGFSGQRSDEDGEYNAKRRAGEPVFSFGDASDRIEIYIEDKP